MTPDSQLFGPPFSVPLIGVDPSKSIYVPIQMQLAITPDEDHHGLMFKKHLDDEAGMLFLYKDSARRVLYMRNTEIPLDAGWFTHEGTLKEVMQMAQIEDETWRWSKDSDIQWGLEMNLNWFQKKGLKPGEVKLDMDALKVAIMNRGYSPADYGIAEEQPSGPSTPARNLPAGDSAAPENALEEAKERQLTAAMDSSPAAGDATIANSDRMIKFLSKAEETYMHSA